MSFSFLEESIELRKSIFAVAMTVKWFTHIHLLQILLGAAVTLFPKLPVSKVVVFELGTRSMQILCYSYLSIPWSCLTLPAPLQSPVPSSFMQNAQKNFHKSLFQIRYRFDGVSFILDPVTSCVCNVWLVFSFSVFII